jgi:Zn-finger protein
VKQLKKDGKKVITSRYKSFKHKTCEFFPCHNNINIKNFSCLLCFCPRYEFCWDRNYEGKDCSQCIYPHLKSNYKKIMRELKNRL